MSEYIKLEDVIRVIDDNFDSIPMEQTIEILQTRRTIRNLPTIEVSEDAISREWVLNRLTKYQKDYALNELDDWQNTVVEWITTDIENAPSVVPKPKEGECIECHYEPKDEPQTGEMMTEEEFDSMLARALTGNNESQTERSSE